MQRTSWWAAAAAAVEAWYGGGAGQTWACQNAPCALFEERQGCQDAEVAWGPPLQQQNKG